MQIEEITEYSEGVVEALTKLLPQLSKNAVGPSDELARRIVESEAAHLLFAKEGERILGMLTIVIFPIPTGVRAWIEDVVVDESGAWYGCG